jgi:hypothetical protein
LGEGGFWFEGLAVVGYFLFVFGLLRSLYLRALVSMSSFSKSLRRDLKIFLGFSPVWSAISWRVSSPFFSASTTSWSVLLSFTMAGVHLVGLCLMACGAFQFCGKPHCKARKRL